MNNIFEYALVSLFRGGAKNLFIGAIFTFLVFLLSSVIFIVTSLKHEHETLIAGFPDIVVSQNIGGRRELIDEKFVDEFLSLPATSRVVGRVWGEYRFKNESGAGAYVTLLGLNIYENGYGEILENITQDLDVASLDENFMISSKSVWEFLKKQIGVYDSVPFFTPQSFLILTKPSGTFSSQNSLFDNDVVIVGEENARVILSVDEGKFSDIIISLANSAESEVVANKIALAHPEFRVQTKSQIMRKFELLYDFKGGLFLAIMLICAATFGVILFDKLSGLKSEEKREIAILRSVGWDVGDVMRAKTYESLVLSVGAFFVGLALAIFYVYFAGVPVLAQVLGGFGNLEILFRLEFYFDFKIFTLLFLLSVPLYVAISLIPSFRVAITDIGEALK